MVLGQSHNIRNTGPPAYLLTRRWLRWRQTHTTKCPESHELVHFVVQTLKNLKLLFSRRLHLRTPRLRPSVVPTAHAQRRPASSVPVHLLQLPSVFGRPPTTYVAAHNGLPARNFSPSNAGLFLHNRPKPNHLARTRTSAFLLRQKDFMSTHLPLCCLPSGLSPLHLLCAPGVPTPSVDWLCLIGTSLF